MDNLFNGKLDPETVIDMSDPGYMNNEIGLTFFDILLSTQRVILLLRINFCYLVMQNRMTEESKQLTHSHNIILHKYSPHLTHIMHH